MFGNEEAGAARAGGGALAEIDFLISGSMIAGDSLALDLTGVSLNEGALAVAPNPLPGPDAADGLVHVAQRTVSLSADVALPEGDSGTTSFQYEIILSHNSAQTVTVKVATGGGTASASSGDYGKIESQVFTFAPLETRKTVTVQVNGDTDSEPDETFVVILSDAVGAEIARGQALGTIENDDLAQAAQLHVTLAAGPTATGPNGEVPTLPAGGEWLDEWSACTAEIWADTPQSDNAGVSAASFRLAFTSAYFTATTVEAGPAFRDANGNATSTVDGSAGTVDFAGTTSLTDVGDDRPLLVARITFRAPPSGPGLPHSRGADYIQPPPPTGCRWPPAESSWSISDLPC